MLSYRIFIPLAMFEKSLGRFALNNIQLEFTEE